jgi:hypothetical protein
MGNVPDLPQNKKPVHLHFYPRTFKFGKQKSLAMSVQVEAQHSCSKSSWSKQKFIYIPRRNKGKPKTSLHFQQKQEKP